MPVVLKALTEKGLVDFRALLGASHFGGCFCAAWFAYDERWAQRCHDPSQPNYRLTEARVREGHHVGYLVYGGDRLIGWTGAGPKAAFPLLATKLASRRGSFTDGTWSIGCIAISAENRGQKLSAQIIDAVIEEARSRGATRLEAYPTRPFDAARMYRGDYKAYERLGFDTVDSERDGGFDILLMEKRITL